MSSGATATNNGLTQSVSTTSTIPSEVSNPVIQPIIPYTKQIPGGLKPGMRLHVEGSIPLTATQFCVNFRKMAKIGDVAFNFNPCINSTVCMDSIQNGKWQKKEFGPIKPFVKEASFKLLFILTKDSYLVHVNGKHLYTFNHRIPLESVLWLEIAGDVTIDWLGFDKRMDPLLLTNEKKPLLMRSGGSTFIPLEIFHLISKPAIPYVGYISVGLNPEKALVFQGTLPADSKGFIINLKTGPDDGDDIAFHYNISIGKFTTLNSFRNGRYEKEEKIPYTPFTEGQAFTILVVNSSTGYEVFVDGVKHCTFTHRIPSDKVFTVDVRGDVSLFLWGIIYNWSTTLTFRELKRIQSQQSSTSSFQFPPQEISNLVVYPQVLPHATKLPGESHQNKAIFIQGMVPVNATGFTVNLKTGPANTDDIAFQYNPCIGKFTSLNSFRNGTFETQEAVSDKPFTMGEAFQMIVAINSEGYEVYVNGSKHCVFKHRIPLEKVSTLEIRRDLSQLILGFIDNWSTSLFFTELQKVVFTESYSPVSELKKFHISHPIRSETFPLSFNIPGGIKKNMAVFCQGSVSSDAKSFTFDFKAGNDIAFHYKPNIGSYTSMNSLKNNVWGAEQRLSKNTFNKGEAFQIIIVINPEAIEIYVNGSKQCVFKHRIPMEKVTALEIHGDLSKLLYGVIYSWRTSSLFEELQKIIFTKSFMISDQIINPALPYVGKIPSGLKDLVVIFQGSVPQKAKRFVITFKTGSSAGDDIAFNYNPCIGNNTTMNSCRNGTWDSEEITAGAPFAREKEFQLFFLINREKYEVYVNGLSHCSFKHRIPFAKVSTISVDGDVIIKLLGFDVTWKSG